MSNSLLDMFPLYVSSSMDKDLKSTDKLCIGIDGRSIDSAPWPLSTTWIENCPTGKSSGKPLYGPINLRVHTRANLLRERMRSLEL